VHSISIAPILRPPICVQEDIVFNRKYVAAVLFSVCLAGGFAGNRSDIHYDGLGVVPGHRSALPFGAALLSSAGTRERVVAIDPDGTELFYTVIAAAGPQIMQSSFRDGRWQAPVRASFSDAGVNTEPSFSPDGRTLYFVSNRAPSRGTDIWKVERAGDHWGVPVHLGAEINGAGFEWHPQVTASGDLYFAAADRADGSGDADLYVARFEHGAYLPAGNLGAPINSAAAEWDPWVSANGSVLLFKSDRVGGHGGRDIWLSERKDGAWSAPRNAGPAINTADDEDSGDLTPDGRFLIFARSKPGAEAWKMYWIDARAVFPK
jgi:Tol biopolymer transport system component